MVADWDAYEELAVALATDAPRLRELQRRLSTARSTAPLFDTRRCALIGILRDRRRCELDTHLLCRGAV